jgi:hypothetical protein
MLVNKDLREKKYLLLPGDLVDAFTPDRSARDLFLSSVISCMMSRRKYRNHGTVLRDFAS